MNNPRSSAGGAIAAIPEGFGLAIPSNPQDLLLLIQKQHKKNINKISKHTDVIGRAQKQEQQRESYENRLMEFEDFIYKPEGADRLNRQFEHMRMETEDELSMQLVMVERSKKKVDFKEQVRLEVEERVKREGLEREAKRKAAEDRRAAVVERLRKKAEDEERRKKEAEDALLRILQEGERREQQARDRLANDRSAMVMEDDLSRLAEQDFKELQERALWERREREKVAELERALLAKDAEEAEARKTRMAALEEKKAKLAELKRLQGLNGPGTVAGGAAQTLQSTRDEAAKLDKQLRIQNKAKFVTKKIQTNANSANEAVPVLDAALLLGGDAPHSEMPKLIPSTTTRDSADITSVPTTLSTVAAKDASSAVPSADAADFQAVVSATDSESELKAMQRDLMAEKRALRLEQKQRLAGHGAAGAAQDPAEIEHAKELRRRIAEVTQREGAVQRRLEQLLAASQASTSATAAGSAVEYAKTAKAAAAASSAELSALLGQQEGVTTHAVDTSTIVPGNDQLALYAKAEHMLREGQHLLKWLAEKNQGDGTAATAAVSAPVAAAAPGLGMTRKSFGQSFVFARSDDATMLRRATLLSMEAAQLARDMDPLRDSGSYGDSLSELSKSLKAALAGPGPGPGPSSVAGASAPSVVAVSSEGNNATLPATVSKIHASASTSHIPKVEERGGQKVADLLTSASSNRIPEHSPHKTALSSELAVVKSSAGGAATVPSHNVFAEAAPKPEHSGTLTAAATSPVPAAPESAIPAATAPAEECAVESIRVVAAAPPATAHAEGEVCADEEGEEEGGAGAEEAQTNFEDLPGWEECLTTSMASAAHHAAFYGYIEVLDCLCRYFDCFVMDKKGRTPLFYAALQNRLNCVASLVALDPQWIDVGDQNGDTSLHAAAIANGVEVLSFLLQCEANPDTANYAGLTPCHLARTRAALEVLCSAGAMPYCVDSKSRMPLWFACNEGRSDCAEFLCTVTPVAYILWPDEEGETCLHRAAMGGHAQCVEALAQQLPATEDLYTANKKQHTAAHVASSAGVLKALYESGASLWTPDPKGRMPLFTASFFGRADCIAFLLDVASNSTSTVSVKVTDNSAGKVASDDRGLVGAPDFQGDTALHVACLCGHVRCVSLLLFFTQCTRNKQGLTPDQLATKAGHAQIAQMVAHVHQRRESEGLSSMQIYGCEFSVLSSVTLYYGSRWAKLYDVSFDTVYYLDRATGQSQWDRPEAFDEPAAEEHAADKARAVLHRFYSQYNPEKLCSMNDILLAYKGKYTDLFISLANKYNVQDLSMFEGVELD